MHILGPTNEKDNEELYAVYNVNRLVVQTESSPMDNTKAMSWPQSCRFQSAVNPSSLHAAMTHGPRRIMIYYFC
jgi:hypothetical protein